MVDNRGTFPEFASRRIFARELDVQTEIGIEQFLNTSRESFPCNNLLSSLSADSSLSEVPFFSYFADFIIFYV
jgi:hypothetical protein